MPRPVLRFVVAVAVLGALVSAMTASSGRAPYAGGPPPPAGSSPEPPASVSLPVVFVPNLGQYPDEVKYVARDRGATVLFTDRDTVFVPDYGEVTMSRPVRLRFGDEGARRYRPGARQPFVINEYRGDDPSRWRTAVPVYGELTIEAVAPGIDVVFRRAGGRLEYDVRLAPGIDARRARLVFDGIDRLVVEADGTLAAVAAGWSVLSRPPRTYQVRGGLRTPLPSAYVVEGTRAASFDVAPHDPAAETVVVDPEITYSTAIRGDLSDRATALVAHPGGTAFVAGYTNSGTMNGAPVSPGPPSGISSYVTFVAKLTPGGSAEWITFLGGDGARGYWHGGSVGDRPTALAVDAAGQPVVAGMTSSTNFPVKDAFQASPLCPRSSGTYPGPCHDAFVAKLGVSGTLAYSTYVGGRDGFSEAGGVIVDATGAAWVAGRTSAKDFETTQSIADATGGGVFLLRLSPAGSLGIATRFGDAVTGVAGLTLDPMGQPVVAGTASRLGLPLRGAVLDRCPVSCAFVAKLDASARSVVYATYFGGTGGASYGSDVAVDAHGRTVLTGVTTPGLPLLDAWQPAFGGGSTDAFLAGFTATGALAFSSYLGGEGADGGAYDRPLRVGVDAAGAIVVAGRTDSLRFPLLNPTLGAAHTDGPVFRSDNGGDSWGVANVGLSEAVKKLGSDPRAPLTMYAATNNGLFRTEDGGATWRRLPFTGMSASASVPALLDVVVDPRDSAIVYASTFDGAFRSRDRGQTWQRVGPALSPSASPRNVAISAVDGSVMLSSPGVYVSTDGGLTWADRSQFLRVGPTGVRSGPEVVVADPRRAGTIWAGTSDGLFLTRDRGESWREVIGERVPDNYGREFVRALAIDPRTGVIIAGTFNRGILRSGDAGETWQRVVSYRALVALAFDAVLPNVVYALTSAYDGNGPVLRSTDSGLTWERKDAGIRNRYLDALAPMSGRGASLMAGGSLMQAGFLARLEPVPVGTTSGLAGRAVTGRAGAVGAASVPALRVAYSTYLEAGEPQALAVTPDGRILLAVSPRPGTGVSDADVLVIGVGQR